MSFVRFLQRELKLEVLDIKSALSWFKDQFTVSVKAEKSKRPRDSRPLLKINASMDGDYAGNYNALHMCMLSEDRHVITSPTHCRDYLNEAIRWHVCGGKNVHSHHCSESFEGDLDMRKLRMLLLLDHSIRPGVHPYDGIKNGVRLANMYGRVAGWSPIRLVRANIPHKNDTEKDCYVLIGDRNWQRTPQYISMLLLLIRLCLVWEVPEWIKDAYALTGYWHEFIYDTKDRPDNSDVTVFLTNSYHHMLLMVAHDREIFPHNMLSAYSSSHESFHGSSGINALVRGETIHPESTKRLKHYYNTEVLLNARSD